MAKASFHIAWLLLGMFASAWAEIYSGVEDFEALTAKHDLVVASFCLPWFAPCQVFSVELKEADRRLSPWEVPIVKIDCNTTASFCASLDVVSFPTVRLFKGKEYRRYREKFRASPLSTRVLGEVLPPVTKLDQDSLQILGTLDKPLLVAVISEDDAASSEAFAEAATALKSDFILGTVAGLELGGLGNLQPPSLVVFNLLDETNPTYAGPFETSEIISFAKKVSSPLIGKLELARLKEYIQSGVPLAMVFAEEAAERASLANTLKDVAMKFRGRVNFATADARKLSFLLEPLGLQKEQLPAFAIQSKDTAFPFDQSQQITSDAIEIFIEKSLVERDAREKEL